MNAMPIILILEPNVLFRQMLKSTIHTHFPELDIIESDTAEDALNKSIVKKPQLILMDIQLGTSSDNGLDLIHDIAVRQPYTRIAVLTGRDEEEYRKEAFRNGADYFLSKAKPNGKKMLEVIRATLMAANP